MAACSAADGQPAPQDNPHRVVYDGSAGPGEGRHIVLIAGDHEYRSEEILPALARILARRFGFRCSVFFTLDEEGFIEPGSSRIAGLDALETADLLILAIRFQDFPASEMQHIVNYLDRGGPVIGLRTSTHAFRIASGPFAKYSWDYPGEDYRNGFGRQVLGETWVGHYGTNHEQSSRIIPVEAQSAHPILRGVRDVHVQSGGYQADPSEGSTVLAVGQVLDGMGPDAPPDPDKQLMPVAWTRAYESGGRRPRVFTTTHGASEDFLNEGFRRMLVNAALWAVGLESAIHAGADVSFVGPFHPTRFSFDGYRRGVRPADLAGWDSPIMSPDRPTRDEPRAGSGEGSARREQQTDDAFAVKLASLRHTR
ncbi:MAG: ThuA domain-containing protein [Gemmatimonadetes bacterium]|nr:ThuA domain-containing protein [Gemmatimonadota bacterium]